MKIKEFSIIRYGPLPKMERVLLSSFNLFFGKNEEGKTLTIDALVKMLLKQNIKDFQPGINRVEEAPEGYVIIEDNKNKEIKLPEKGNLTKLVSLTSSECRNIFIIRNSDLSIVREGEFYTNVTDRLTGLRTKQILSIKKELQKLGKLTRADSSASFSNSEEFVKIKSRLNDAKKLIKGIDLLGGEIKKENFDKLEEESIRIRGKIDEIKQKREGFEKARRREKYEKGKEALETLKQTLKKSKDLEVYNEDDERLWRDNERDVKTNKEEREKLLLKLNEKEKKFQDICENLKEREREFQLFEERRKKLDNEIKPEIKNYEIKNGELIFKEEKSKFFTFLGTISAILFGISLPGIIIKPSLLFYILAALFSILAITSGIFKFQFVKDRAHLRKVFEKIKLTISKFGLEAENIKGVLFNIQKFDEEYSKKTEELEEVRGEKKLLESEKRELKEERIVEIGKKIENARRKIDSVKSKSKEESLQEYTKKLKLKLNCKRWLEEQKGILKALFGENKKGLEESILCWDEEIKDLEKYEDEAENIKYNEKSVSELKEKEELLEEELSKIKEKMVHFQKELEKIERKANEILGLEIRGDYLHCETSIDLDAVKDKLQEWLNENENNKDNVLKVMKIFEEIEREERGKVSELFGKESSVSNYFNEITDGLYEEVIFNQETGRIEVKCRDGLVLNAEKLSGGAYDQLYLSIRLALGEKLLKGYKGFFIMDDPFVKASPDRLQRQNEMKKKISNLGWQIIYFTAKGEVKDALKEDINSKEINYLEIKRSPSRKFPTF